MRQNKPFSVITYTKPEEPKLHFKCKIHQCRLLEIPDKGLWCPEGCGPSIPATRTVYINEKNPSAQAQ